MELGARFVSVGFFVGFVFVLVQAYQVRLIVISFNKNNNKKSKNANLFRAKKKKVVQLCISCIVYLSATNKNIKEKRQCFKSGF